MAKTRYWTKEQARKIVEEDILKLRVALESLDLVPDVDGDYYASGSGIHLTVPASKAVFNSINRKLRRKGWRRSSPKPYVSDDHFTYYYYHPGDREDQEYRDSDPRLCLLLQAGTEGSACRVVVVGETTIEKRMIVCPDGVSFTE